MLIKQLSVFIENRNGRLERITEVLSEHNINIASFSLADTMEYGMLRMIVSDPERGKQVLKEEGFTAMLTDVIAVKIAQRPGTLHEILKLLFEAGLSVEYMYTLNTSGDNTSIVMKVSNFDDAFRIFNSNQYQLFYAEEAYLINNCVDK